MQQNERKSSLIISIAHLQVMMFGCYIRSFYRSHNPLTFDTFSHTVHPDELIPQISLSAQARVGADASLAPTGAVVVVG